MAGASALDALHLSAASFSYMYGCCIHTALGHNKNIEAYFLPVLYLHALKVAKLLLRQMSPDSIGSFDSVSIGVLILATIPNWRLSATDGRHHVLDARIAGRLDGGGAGELRAKPRDTVPGREVGRPVPDAVDEDPSKARATDEGGATTSWRVGTVHRFKVWCKSLLSSLWWLLLMRLNFP